MTGCLPRCRTQQIIHARRVAWREIAPPHRPGRRGSHAASPQCAPPVPPVDGIERRHQRCRFRRIARDEHIGRRQAILRARLCSPLIRQMNGGPPFREAVDNEGPEGAISFDQCFTLPAQ
jgi:hypothetical protein